MKNKSKIIAGGIIITSAIGATSFAIIDPYNMLKNKKADIPEKSLKLTENIEENKEVDDSKKESDNMGLNEIKDGTYLGVSKGYGGEIKVNVTIENGKIKNVEVISHSETPRYFEKGSKVIEGILKENSTNVDSISGATLTSDGIKNAVKDALSKAGFKVEKNNNEKDKSNKSSKTVDLKASNSKSTSSVDLKEYKLKDGSYIGEAIGFKGNIKVKVIISGGKLSDVKVISHNEDAEFFNKAKGVIIKILRNQGTSGVDTVSGATYSSRGILNAVNSALNKVAKENKGVINNIKISNNIPLNSTNSINVKDIVKGVLNQNSIMISRNPNNNINLKDYKFKDGEYIGEAKGFNGNIKTKVVIKNGTLVNIEIVNHKDDEEFFKSAKKLIFKILKNQGTTGIDAVSGATYSSNGILNSVNDALKKATNKESITKNNVIVSNKDTNLLQSNKDVANNSNKKEDKDNINKGIRDLSKDNTIKIDLNDKDVKFLDGEYIGVGRGFKEGNIKSKVVIENNKIKSIEVATIESGDYGDDGDNFREKAIKVIDFMIGEDRQKVFNDLMLHDKLYNEILDAEDSYEKAKELTGKYAEILKNESKSENIDIYRKTVSNVVKDYLKEKNKANVFDAVSGATYSAKGIARSIQDAMKKSANDYKTGNTINNLKIKTPSKKSMNIKFEYADKEEKLDLSNLKVILSTKDGKEKEVSYDKFKENGIEIYDQKTGKPIYDGMKLDYKSIRGYGVDAIIEHKNSLYKDKLLILPMFSDKNYLTGIEYSIDEGKTWNEFSNLVVLSKNINSFQTIKLPKELKGKNILLRVLSANNDKYLLQPEKDGEVLKIENKRYALKTTEKEKLSNYNIPRIFSIGFEFTENEKGSNIKNTNSSNSPVNKDEKYLDGVYTGSGMGYTTKPIKSKVTFENNKIKSIEVATKESGDYGDDETPFRDKAIKVVDILKENPEKAINDVLLLDEITNKILSSKNPYETGKELIGDYAEKLKDVEKDTFDGPTVKTHTIVAAYLKERKNSIALDAVSGATYSGKGIIKSVKDAMDKSANDYKTGNSVNDLKIKTPGDKNIFVDFINSEKEKKLDLSNLKVVLRTKDGKEKEVPYDKFKENDIEIYNEETKEPISHEMSLNRDSFNGMNAVVRHKKSLYNDKLTIINHKINDNYITGFEYSLDNGVKWNKVSDLKKIYDTNNIHFEQELKISKEDKNKASFRLVSKNGDKYNLEIKEKIEGTNGYYYLNPRKEDQAKNKNIPSGFYIRFKYEDTSKNEIAKNFENVSYVRIYLNDSQIYKKHLGKLKVGDTINWTGAKFKFKNRQQESIRNIFTEEELNKLTNREEFEKKGSISYEDLGKLGIEISPKQGTKITDDMIPSDKNYSELQIKLNYKGKTLKVRGGGINGDDDFAGIFLNKKN